jgi:hypothetical protein
MISVFGVGQEKKSPAFFLKNPQSIRLELRSRKAELNEDPKHLLDPFTTSSKIYFRLMATNTSFERATLLILDPYFQNRPLLFRDGDILPYRTGLNALLAAKDKDPFITQPQAVNLTPDETRSIGYIYLEDWYGQLPVGHYQLSLKHRFEVGQEWIESSSITFDVVAKSNDKEASSTGRLQ